MRRIRAAAKRIPGAQSAVYLTRYLKRVVFGRPSIELVRRWHSRCAISMMRISNSILLSTDQLEVISTIVKRKAPCKLLIFGLGNDSVFWSNLNRGGVTIFLEDNEDWYRRITKRSKGLTAFLVDYNTKRSDWKRLLESPSLLSMTLPSDVEKEKWDVILVDGPAGEDDQKPGRMKSIFLSSRLVADSGDIFVHDCEREIEDAYCNVFLKRERLKREIQAPRGLLRHYHITRRCT